MSTDSILDAAAELAVDFEGFSSVAYLDPVKVPTIGYGSTHDYRLPGRPRVTMQTPPVNKQVALGWLREELRTSLALVEHSGGDHLSDEQEAALSDFVYNLGAGAFLGSTLRKDLLKGDYAAAAGEFAKWDHAGGKVLAGLLRRRLAEEAMFTSADLFEPKTA